MYPLWDYYSSSVRERFKTALKSSGKSRIKLRFFTPTFLWNGRIKEELIDTWDMDKANVITGTVSVESTRTAPTRQLDLTFLDTENHIRVGDIDRTVGIGPGRLISVIYQVYVPGYYHNEGWIDIPIFHGHLTSVSKDGYEVNFVGFDKSVRYLEPCIWNQQGSSRQIRQGMLVTEAIMQVLKTKGENYFRFPGFNQRVRKDQLLQWNDVPWAFCQKLAQAHSMALYFDGQGYCRLRSLESNKADYELDGEYLLEYPSRELDYQDMRNVVVVLGEERQGKQRVRAVSRNSRHPLDFNIIKQWKIEVIENSEIKTYDQAKALANQALQKKEKSAFSIEVATLTVPHLEEWDRVLIRNPILRGLPGWEQGGQVSTFRVGKFTIPLDNTSPMTLNKEEAFSYKLKKKRGRKK